MYVDPVLNLYGWLCGLGFIFSILLKKNIISAIFFFQSIFHFHAYESALFYEGAYSSYIYWTDALILILCVVDRYGRDIIAFISRSPYLHIDR